ncbi:hypothetical protein [Streptomyces pseudogriseolus]|uniref:hypothetical protein n=1 Tax=Streptomyces pseudogriseolus TaxID=36817 RepID=UPI001319CB60|nr:hypothetical protein [Streptomyces gancidicus]
MAKEEKKRLGFSRPIRQDDPRLDGFRTTIQPSRGWWYPEEPKPVPGTPKSGRKRGRG